MNIIIKNRCSDIEKLLEQHTTISVMGMPSGGISVLLKQLASANLGFSVYVDVFGLASLTTEGLFRAIEVALGIPEPDTNHADQVQECIRRLQELGRKHSRIIIYFGGFDQMIDAIDGQLLQSLQALARSSGNQVKLVFGLCTNLKRLIPDAHFDSGLRLFGTKYYMGGYTIEELRYLLREYGPRGVKTIPDLDQRLTLAGGHLNLLMLLVNSKSEHMEMRNEAMNLLFYNIYTQLAGPQRTIVRNLAFGRKQPPDEYLVGIGMVQVDKLFSPLFASYIVETYKNRLPAKERRLFLLLKRNAGQVVSKQEIMDIVWRNEIVSEWALNALIYRLRKHPAFVAQNYTIENHKKLGYMLVKSYS